MLFSKETILSYAHSIGITEIEDDALKVLAQDLEYRIKELCQEAEKVMLASHRAKLSIDDINYVLLSRSIDPLFGYDPQESLTFKSLPPNVYYVPDNDIDLEEFLNSPLPRIPSRPSIQSHWLAIEGVQPQVPQNPLITEKVEPRKDILTALAEDAELKQQNKHILPKELQLYFDKILSMIKSDMKDVAIECLLNESGLQQLVPYFIQHFSELIMKNFKDAEILKTAIALYFSLIKNSHIFIDPYLHQILPSLLTCVIGKSIEDGDVRRLAAEIIKYIYENYSRSYKTLAPRVLNTLTKVWLDPSRSEESQYGALYCLSIISVNVVETIVRENEQEYRQNIGKERVLALLDAILDRNGKDN